MSWWSLLPGGLALTAIVLVPGALALRVLGVRGLAGIAAAPPVTVGAVGALSVLFGLLGVSWRALPVVTGLACLLMLLAVGVRLLRRHGHAGAPSRQQPAALIRRDAVLLTTSLASAFLLLVMPFIATLPSPDAPLQQWDAVFHLNAVAVVRETGVATPLGGLAPLYGDGVSGAPYYPTGWHAVVALSPIASVPAATNVAILVLGVAVWLLGLAGLARELFVGALVPSVFAPLVAATFVAFPVVQLTVLAQFPNGLSSALLPGALLLTVRAVRATQARAGPQSIASIAVAAVTAGIGVVVAHASGLFSLAVLAGPLLVAAGGARALDMVRDGRRGAGALTFTGLAVAVIGLPVVAANLGGLSAVVGFERASGRSHLEALREIVLDQTLVYGYPSDGFQHLLVTVATVAGVILAFVRREHRWVAASFVLTVGLAVLASGPEEHPLRWLAGFWYTQAGRIAPVAVVPAVLLSVYAVHVALERSRRRGGWVVVAAVSAAAVGIVGTAFLRLPLQQQVVVSAYVPGQLAWGTMATEAELALIRRLHDAVGPDALVVGDPFNGSALLPGVAGIDVVFPQLGASRLSPEEEILQARLNQIHEDPSVCAALDAVGATHLYQDSAGTGDGAKVDDRTAGMRDVDVSVGFTEVDRAGSAAVYEIELCAG